MLTRIEMGGGDLNTKKSWHPTNARNQERVWKAEQKDAAEKKKLAELQKQIQEERDLEEAKQIARNSGYIDDNPDKKLEWMYKGQQLNREEYLTGRAIDKNFEELSTTEQQPQHPGIQVPKNHVEHEVIPFSIRQFKGTTAPAEQVDMARKVMEDPLMLIKQKEMEMRRKVLENPVRLKEVYKILKKERTTKGSKDQKPKKKKKKRSKSSSSSDSDLDKVLAEKYKKLQGILQPNDSDEDGNLDKMIGEKFQTLTKELDKITGSKKKDKKKKRSDSSSSDDFHVTKQKRSESPRQRRSPDRRRDNNFRQSRDQPSHSNHRESFRPRRSPERQNFRHRNPSPRRRQSPFRRNSSSRRRRSPSPENHRPNRNHSPQNRRPSPRRYQRSPSPRKHRSKSPRNKQRSPPPKNRKRSPEKAKSASSSSVSSPERPDRQYDSDSTPPAKKAFGLVAADGKRLHVSKSNRRSRSPKHTIKPTPKVSGSSKSEFKRSKPSKLTQEEIEAKLKEMEANAKWRDKERTEKVHKHREKEKREQEDITKEFDQDFLNRQLKKTSNSMKSVESRIKSNLGNIQRSSRVMDSNFARR